MKKGLTNVGGLKISDLITPRIFSVFFNPWILIGLFLYGVSMVFWLVALSSFDVSFMYPLVSFAYVLTTFLAIIFLKEHVTLFRWAGVLLIVGGSFLMLRS
jgi:drug/metabolite transporter (DMT)-like permease